MKKESVIQYELFENSPDEFSNYLRVNLEWDESKYQEMLFRVRAVLKDYSNSDFFPKSVRYFFTMNIDHIIGTVSNELFFKSVPSGFNHDEYVLFIDIRKKELTELKEEFFYGEI